MSKKILVIEDEKTTLNSIVQFLISEGFETSGVTNGREGIEFAQEKLPDLIICDILMPELDGYDVLSFLQQVPETSTIPFIFLTATTDSSSFRIGMEMGADDYLRKPVTSAELLSAIANRLDRQELNEYSSQPNKTNQQKVLNESDSQQIVDYSEAQNSLIKFLLNGIKSPINKLNQELIDLKEVLSGSGGTEQLNNLEVEFARLQSIVNQVSELNEILTPENTQILKQFDFLQDNFNLNL